MEESSPPLAEVPGTEMPLRIIVSEAGQLAALKSLVAQSIPMLRSPGHFREERRCELAQRLARAICPSRGTDAQESPDLDSEGVSEDASAPWLEDDA